LEPDGDENVFEIEGAANAIAVETLMGWDGDKCECACQCPRFQDQSDDRRCTPCIEGEHWPHDAERRTDDGT
jgi:hypothetical protein